MAYTITFPHTADSMGIYIFKKTVNVTKNASFKINIFASIRYILYINGEYICEGPCRSAHNVSYDDCLTIKPTTLSLSYAKGDVPTRFGNVNISRKIDGGIFSIDINSESEVTKRLFLPNGNTYEFCDKAASFCCEI